MKRIARFAGIVLFVGLCAWVKAFIWIGRKLAESKPSNALGLAGADGNSNTLARGSVKGTQGDKYVWGWDS